METKDKNNVNAEIEMKTPPEQPFIEKEFVIRSFEKGMPIIVWSARESVDHITIGTPYPSTTVAKGDVVIKGDEGTAVIYKDKVASVIIALEKIIGE